MDVEQVVYARESIRSFQGRDVPEELVQKLLAYGHAAPSAGNVKAWRFIVTRDGDMKKRLTACTYGGNREAGGPQRWIETAPVIITVCADYRPLMARYNRHGLDSLLYLDASACIENMILGAVYLGLGSCYISGFRRGELAEVLGLPGHLEAVAMLPVGYPAGEGLKRPRAPQEEVTWYERFGGTEDTSPPGIKAKEDA
jgi:nitroreductase